MKSSSLPLASAILEPQLLVDTSTCSLSQPGPGLLLKWAVLPFSYFFATLLLVPAQVFNVAVLWPSPVKEEWWRLKKVYCGGVGLGLRKSAMWIGSSLISLGYVSTSKPPSGSAELTALNCSRLQCVFVCQETYSCWYFVLSDVYKHQ